MKIWGFFIGASAMIWGIFAGNGVAMAQDESLHPLLDRRLIISGGVFWPWIDTKMALNGKFEGTEIDFEDELGLDDTDTLPMIYAKFRLTRRWNIQFSYISLDRDNSKIIDETIIWGDKIFPVGANVEGGLETDIYRLSLGYSFLKDREKAFGLALGLHVMDIKAALSSRATIDGETVLDIYEDEELTAPLPTIGLFGSYAFSPKFLLNGRFDFFYIDTKKIDGGLIDVRFDLNYQAFKYLGFGLGYRYVYIDGDIDYKKFDGKVRYNYHGPILMATFSYF